MSFEKSIFEKEGLKIDKNRVLTYSQLSCPLDCKYCFVDDMNLDQKKNVAYLSENQLKLLKELPAEVSVVMIGCDTEFFQHKEKSLQILEKLSDLGKDISVITKMSLSNDFIKKLESINSKLKDEENILAFSATIPCMDSAKEWEPKAPTPGKRIETMKNVFVVGIKTMVAIRPLLPTISDEELEKIIISTKDCCSGYYSGPLYLKNLESINGNEVNGLKIEQLQPHWMPEGNVFYKIEKEGQMDLLKKLIEKNGKLFFEGAAEGIKHLKNL